MKNIVFIGMIGSEIKNTAKTAADILNVKYVDTDEVLMRNIGMPLHDLYTLFPLDSFRELNYKLAAQLSENGNYAIALGDSILTNKDAVEVLKENSFLVYLKQDIEEIVNNCAEPSHPLLARGVSRLYELYSERSDSFYEYADIVVDYSDNAVEIALSAYREADKTKINTEPALTAFFKYYIEQIAPEADSEAYAQECVSAISEITAKYATEV